MTKLIGVIFRSRLHKGSYSRAYLAPATDELTSIPVRGTPYGTIERERVRKGDGQRPLAMVERHRSR